MDGEKFDDLLKRICTTRLTRLDALRGLVAGAAAALTGATLGSDETEAKKKGSAQRGGVKAQGKKNKKGGKGNGKPTNPGGNITCPGGLKVDSGQFQAGKCGNVKHTTNSCECWIRWCVSADGKTLSFGPVEGEVSCLVGSVIVKGGPASEVYEFDSPVPSADGLISPELDNGNLPEISHFTFCDIECPPCDPDDCPEKPCKEAFCDDQGKCAYRPIVCPEPNNKCEEAFCDPEKGCKTRPIDCDDDNACTIDTCHPDKGCKHEPVVCEPDDLCQKDCVCVPKKDGTHECKCEPVVCDDGDPCTIDTCNPKTGQCEYKPVDCDDDNACTIDTCVAKKDGTYQCKHEPVDCDDDDLCTIDTCNPKTGQCEHEPVVCGDDDPCTTDECKPDKGCVHKPVVCEPENECQKDCVCVPKKDGTHECKCEPVVCDDDILCTVDSCDPDKGCKHTPDDDLCPVKPGCDAVCDPHSDDADDNGCVYTCECPGNTSPKQCPPNSGEEFSCKVAASGAGCDVNAPDTTKRPKGSVQVDCGPGGDEPFCYCESDRCVVNGVEYTKGTQVGACSPVSCA